MTKENINEGTSLLSQAAWKFYSAFIGVFRKDPCPNCGRKCRLRTFVHVSQWENAVKGDQVRLCRVTLCCEDPPHGYVAM